METVVGTIFVNSNVILSDCGIITIYLLEYKYDFDYEDQDLIE